MKKHSSLFVRTTAKR